MLLTPEISKDAKITNASEAEQASREAKRRTMRLAQLTGQSQTTLAKALIGKSGNPELDNRIKLMSPKRKARIIKQLVEGNLDLFYKTAGDYARKGKKKVSRLLKGLKR